MKKITLLLALLSFVAVSNEISAQELLSENFDSLIVGDVGTDIDGSTLGQGNLVTLVTGSGANSDFQIATESGKGNILEVIGSSNASDARLVWKNGLVSPWSNRTPGNDIIEIEYDFYTGSATTSKAVTGVRLYNSNLSITICGFRFVPETKVITGLARFDNSGTVGTFFFNLGAGGSQVVLAEDTWYRVGFAFNIATGRVEWEGSGFDVGVNGAAAGIEPAAAAFTIFPLTGNTESTVGKFDEISIRATATENLLNIEESLIASSVKIYPNPANNFVSISASNDLNPTKLEVVDINGRLVKSVNLEKNNDREVDISELSKGLYLMNVYSVDGIITKKIIKQ